MKEQLQALLSQIKKTSFVEGYDASDEQAMGMLISKYFSFDGVACLRVASAALEDCNFHAENQVINQMIHDME